MNDCPRQHCYFGACRFEARYDEKIEPMELPAEASKLAVFFEHSVPCKQYKTYLRDVCTRCGKTIERKA